MVANLDTMPTMLSDGTTFDDLINPEDNTISLRLFTDPEIYRLELQRLFTRAWIVLAHESEVPKPGDYLSRSIGQDPVIMSVGSNTTPLLMVVSDTVTLVCPAGKMTVLGSGTKSCPGCAVPATAKLTAVSCRTG